jgi:hypothetical protein
MKIWQSSEVGSCVREALCARKTDITSSLTLSDDSAEDVPDM